MEKIGIDVHKVASHLCIRTDAGMFVEPRITTTRAAFAKHLGGRARARILIEASTESEWVARCLEALGHEVIVADPNFAPMYATRSRKIKTDRRDARALCEACEFGAYRAAHRSSDTARGRRAQVAVRAAPVSSRTKYISLARALVRQEGYRVRSGSAATFVTRVQAQELPADVQARLAPLSHRLCTAPGIGPVTALTFEAVVDDVARFGSAKEVGSFGGFAIRRTPIATRTPPCAQPPRSSAVPSNPTQMGRSRDRRARGLPRQAPRSRSRDDRRGDGVVRPR